MTRSEETGGPPTPVPDDKDWTWVLRRTCPECGVSAARIPLADAADLVRRSAAPWAEVLAGADVRRRPEPTTWSPLEYAGHVRDVHRVFAARATAMLAAPETEPARFANWDQDATALAERYDLADPARVADELAEAAEGVASVYAGVRPEEAQRRGLRSNGSVFTTTTLVQYHLHDVLHHLVDVGVEVSGEGGPA